MLQLKFTEPAKKEDHNNTSGENAVRQKSAYEPLYLLIMAEPTQCIRATSVNNRNFRPSYRHVTGLHRVL